MYFSIQELNDASSVIHQLISPTPQYAWPLLARHTGCEVWVKHENHTPTGSFKIRGGITYMEFIKVENPDCQGVIAATTGNHGQSIAVSATNAGFASVIVVPENNSPGKNRAMEAQGARLVIHGTDFQEALGHATHLSEQLSFHMVPSFDYKLVKGVASYGMELFHSVKNLHTIYVPIGLGTGICGVICAREALGLTTQIVGVQSEGAPSYALSFEAKRPIATNTVDTFAAGLATRVPDANAVKAINQHAERVVTVSDQEIIEAQALLLRDTHNLSEPAGAAAYAALIKEKSRMKGKKVGIILSGGNAEPDNVKQMLTSPPLTQNAQDDN